MMHNQTLGQDMLTTPVTVEALEVDSSTSSTPAVTSAYNKVTEADVLRIDVDAVSTGAQGLEVRMTFK